MRETMGDLRLGIDQQSLESALDVAGFRSVRILPVRDRLVVGRDRRNFELFLATGHRPAARRKPNRKKTN